MQNVRAIVFAPAVPAAILEALDELLRMMMNMVEGVFGWNPGLELWLLRDSSGPVGTS